MFKDLYRKQRKNNNTGCPKETFYEINVELSKWLLLVNKMSKASKISHFTCQTWGLVTLRWNIKVKLHNFGQIIVNNFQNLNLNWSILPFEIQSQFWWLTGGMCQCDVMFTNTNHFEFWELEIFTCNFFQGKLNTIPTLSYNQNNSETLTFRTLLFAFQTNFQKFLHFSERENKQVPAKMFPVGTFLTL